MWQERLVLERAELCKSVFIEDFQDAIHVLEVTIIRIDINWEPSKVLFVLELGRFLLPPAFNLANGPFWFVLFFDSIEDSHEDVSYCFLSGYLTLVLLELIPVELLYISSLFHLAEEALHSHLFFAFCVSAQQYIKLGLLLWFYHVDAILDGLPR